MKKNKPVGRPKVKDCVKSFTVCLRLSEHARIIKKHGSLKKALLK